MSREALYQPWRWQSTVVIAASRAPCCGDEGRSDPPHIGTHLTPDCVSIPIQARTIHFARGGQWPGAMPDQ